MIQQKKHGQRHGRQFPGEDHNSQQPHENPHHQEPDKAEQHLQKGPGFSITAKLTCLKMSRPVRTVIQCQRMETQYNSFEKWFRENDSNSHNQTLDSREGKSQMCLRRFNIYIYIILNKEEAEILNHQRRNKLQYSQEAILKRNETKPVHRH